MLDREHILRGNDLPRETVRVPEWGGNVIVRCLTAAERDAYEAALYEAKQQGHGIFHNARAQLVCRACCAEDGSRLFLDADAETLGRKNAAAVDRLFAVAQRLSGLGGEAEKELEKNSASGGAEGSPSA